MREVMEPFEPAPVPKTKAKESAFGNCLYRLRKNSGEG